tara:strand:+ start:58 stop:264 length:207 start_codon:yes stop_codon:yes gene_type:complete
MTMTISKEILDDLLSGVKNADDLLGNQGLMKELKVRLVQVLARHKYLSTTQRYIDVNENALRNAVELL